MAETERPSGVTQRVWDSISAAAKKTILSQLAKQQRAKDKAKSNAKPSYSPGNAGKKRPAKPKGILV
tara:strand:+ start:951 stop:1151 length:201 start_codon:yes stop_codon:yes gene_type:complete